MPRARDPNRDKAFNIYKQHNGNIDLVEIANQLNIPPGTVRGWKNKDNWNGTLGINTERSKKEKNVTNKPIAKEVENVLSNSELNDKQRLFCLYFVKSFNATKAYQKAYGCDEYSARTNASRLITKDNIKEEIQRLKQERLNQNFISESDIFQKYMDIAFADISDYLEFGTKEIETSKGTFEISYVDINDSKNVDGTLISEVSQGREGIKIKLADRMKALQWLTDHMNMATEKQKAEIAALRAKTQTEDDAQTEDDGFIDALNGRIDDIWQEE